MYNFVFYLIVRYCHESFYVKFVPYIMSFLETTTFEVNHICGMHGIATQGHYIL